MKRIYALGLLIIVLLLSVNESPAACPTGYTPMTINMSVNGCPYEVEICYNCSPLGAIPGSVSVIGFIPIPMTPPCVQSWTASQVLQHIELYVSNYDFFYTYICPNLFGVPPCPDQSEEIEIRHFNCWQVTLIEYFGDQSYYYQPCDTGVYCLERITWCYDASVPEYKRTVTFGPLQVGTPSCTLEAGDVPLPTKVNDVSPCFILHNACM